MTAAARMPYNTLTIDKVLKTIEALGPIPEEPCMALMKKHGFDPARGDCLVLPKYIEQELGWPGAPRYVKFSELVTGPTLIRGF